MVGVDRVVKCHYCGTWSLVDTPDLVPEYWVAPKLTETDARRALQRLLMESDMPQGLLKLTQFHSSRLFFVPYHELFGRRLGTIVTTQTKSQPAHRSLLPDVEGQMTRLPSLRELNAAGVNKKTVDTRVVMGDAKKLAPAVALPEWNLEEAELIRLRSEPAGTLMPINRRHMESQGKVFDPTISPDQLLSQLQLTSGAEFKDHTEVAETRVKRIFYPAFRVRYRYQGRMFGATLDGVTGKIMSARAPQDDRRRVLWLLGAAAPVCFLVGKVLGAIVTQVIKDPRAAGAVLAAFSQLGFIAIPFLIIGLAMAVFVLGVGWEQFRYPGEIVVTGEKRNVEKIGRPDRTWSDRALDILNRFFDAFMQSARKGRGLS